jgi:uncharacterized protein
MSEKDNASYQKAIALIQDQDYEGAVKVFTRIDGSETDAWEEIAGVLYTGTDVAKRPDDAIAIWRRFASEGSAHSQQVLGAVLVRRDDPDSILEGIEWLEKAGSHGKSYALVNIAQLYYAGHGPIPADPKRCTDYFHRAVELGDTEAMVTLAHYYKIGFGVAQSNHEYLELNRLAADSDHPGAHFNLGINYEHGYVCPINDELAFKHYFIAAEAGFAQAQHNLGARFFNGKGVTQNKRQGIAWYIQAAANDSELSMHCLGLAFLNGDGVDQNPVRALGMFTTAQQHGSTESSPYIETLHKTLSTEEISIAMEYSLNLKSDFQKAIDSMTPPTGH